ncbi:uncharacterized protein BJX67DRAFT_20938 [Aspergillus lucknowensis]|uniref:Ankyrin repeat-containing domain protein n=1 Tax=Aspergillus lucknowensis TaxID=176173 RepID=A0ABR4LX98_9EURO
MDPSKFTPGVELYTKWGRVDKEPNTPGPVPWAAHYVHEQMIRILLDKEKQVDWTDHHGRTALSWAAHQGNTTILELYYNIMLRLRPGTPMVVHLYLGQLKKARKRHQISCLTMVH